MAAHRHLSPPPPPASPPSDSSASVRSTSSLGGLSSSSSLISVFSDIPPPPSIGPKTDAFFASPFSSTTNIPGPMRTDSAPPTPPRSITADFFSTPVCSPPLPRRAKMKASALLDNIHPSRIFPSRYTACHDDDSPAKEFVELESPLALSALSLPSPTNPHRLPTPPPSSPCPPLTLSDDEPTPRPPHLKPAVFVPEPHYVDPSPGCIITSNPPCISNPPTLTVTVTLPASKTSFAAADSNFEVLAPSESSTQLHLIRPLGQGAFSSVWLAQDKSFIPLTLRSRKSVCELRKKASIASISRRSSSRIGTCSDDGSAISLSRKSSLKDNFGKTLERDGSLRMKRLKARLRGTEPVGFGTRYVDERHGEMGIRELTSGIELPASESDMEHHPLYSSPSISASTSTSSAPDSTFSNTNEGLYTLKKKRNSRKGRLVAVKLTPRKPSTDTFPGMTEREREEEEERTRVGFVREVEILKHVSHPNITALLEQMSTSSHHILILPYLPGGDLLGLVNNDIAWSKLGESVLRRIWCELCRAVGWMHGVGLVHRDIKLENILLTTQYFSRLTTSSPRITLDSLPTPPAPLIKLSDFGLSRFIEVDERSGEGELLWTRCGSEAYAAPELVVGTGSARARSQANNNATKRYMPGGSARGGSDYDHDEVTSTTTTARGFYDARETDAWACGVVLYALVGRKLPFGEGEGMGVGSEEDYGEAFDRKRIGGDGMVGYGRRGGGGMLERRQWLMRIARGEYEWPLSSGGAGAPLACEGDDTSTADELVGQRLVQSQGMERIVARLLVQDPRKRARIMDLWDDDWMWGAGGGLAIGMNQVEWRKQERDCQQEQLQLDGSCGEVDRLEIEFGGGGDDGDDLRPDEGVIIGGYYADEGFLCDGEGEKEGEDGEEEGVELEEEEVEELVDGEEGWLLDQEGIGSVARQEVV